jgi:hypothetical protein
MRMRYGRSAMLRVYNELPATAQDAVSALGFGTSTTCSHMHNNHTPSESDGGPLYYNVAGHFWDHHHPNLYAGINQWNANGGALLAADAKLNPSGVRGDIREGLGSMWIHDHKHDFTSQNVYAGLFMASPIYDDIDTGDETKTGTTGLRFPSHSQDAGSYPYEFDVPMMFHDRQFDLNGVDFFPLACLDGAIGDKLTVNGTIQPNMNVQPRRYRLRLYNGGPSRFYWWWMKVVTRTGQTVYEPMTVIANDGNLLPNAVTVPSFKHSVGERFDLIVDFKALAAKYPGAKVYLTNRAEQTNGRGPSGKLLALGEDAIQFTVEAARFGLTDNSTPIVNGMALRPMPAAINVAGVKRKEWVLRGFRQFDAPVSIIVTYDKVLKGNDSAPFDCGAVINALVNAAWSRGLGCVVNSQGIMQSPVVREHAGIAADQVIMKSIALGWPDHSFPANAVVSERKPIEEAAVFVGFDD